MIVGIGTDIVHIDRIEAALGQFGDKFARRVLTDREMEGFGKAKRPAAFLAKRFAAKEATAKAMGRGFCNGLALRQIGIGHDAHGKPGLEYFGVARELKETLGIGESFVSLADEDHYAIAYVTLLRKVG